MTTIIDQLEAPVRVNGNPGYEWTPPGSFDELDSTLENFFVENQQSQERKFAAKLPDEQKTFRLGEPLRREDQFEGIIGCSASLREVFGQARPACTGLVTKLLDPSWLVEIEAEAYVER